MEALVTQVRAREVTVLQHAMVVDVFTGQGQILGAQLVTRDGNWITVHAGAVILATGGAGQLFKFNMNPVDITGDGYAIGYRAGAELFNLEYMQYGLGTVSPLTLFSFWLWPFKPVLRNGEGKEFMPGYLPPGISAQESMGVHAGHFPFTNRLPSRYLEIAIHKELRAGRGGPRGGVLADFRKGLDSCDLTDTARKLWPTTQKWFASRGMELDKQPIEIA
jgi:succinate dehydrogenase/fumarate reductase flavoprotein subunit